MYILNWPIYVYQSETFEKTEEKKFDSFCLLKDPSS